MDAPVVVQDGGSLLSTAGASYQWFFGGGSVRFVETDVVGIRMSGRSPLDELLMVDVLPSLRPSMEPKLLVLAELPVR